MPSTRNGPVCGTADTGGWPKPSGSAPDSITSLVTVDEYDYDHNPKQLGTKQKAPCSIVPGVASQLRLVIDEGYASARSNSTFT